MVLGYWAILRQRRHGLTVEDSGDGLFPPILTGLAFDAFLFEEIANGLIRKSFFSHVGHLRNDSLLFLVFD